MREVRKLRRLLQKEDAVEALAKLSREEWENTKILFAEIAKIAEALYAMEYDGNLDEVVDLLIDDVEYFEPNEEE